MPKRIDCNECKGKGYITLTRMFNDYCGIGNKPCEACGGKGYFEVPMTNADRIRAMSDEELADWIARTQMGAIKDAMNLLRLPCDATDGVVELGKTEALEWLQQPAEGE